jgi:ribonuclease III
MSKTIIPKFKNEKLYKQAFVHRSYLNETSEKLESNERLEFLGDSILSFVISNYLYNKYPEYKEGQLTNLRSLIVNTKSLANFANEIELGSKLLLSKGEEDAEGRKNESLLANAFEALIGALFLDQGIEVVEIFLKQTMLSTVNELVEKNQFKDPKSLLQEYVQSQKYKAPSYRVLEEEGPPHLRIFTIGVYVNDKLIAKGSGTSKQKAEEQAAVYALEKIGEI